MILHRQAWVSSLTHMLPRAKECYELERKYSIRSVHSGRSWGNLTSNLVVSNNLAGSCCLWWPLIKMLTQPIHTEKMNIQKRIACSWFQQYTQLQPQTDNLNKLYRNAALGIHPLTIQNFQFWGSESSGRFESRFLLAYNSLEKSYRLLTSQSNLPHPVWVYISENMQSIKSKTPLKPNFCKDVPFGPHQMDQGLQQSSWYDHLQPERNNGQNTPTIPEA